MQGRDPDQRQRPAEEPERGAVQARYRRAFGCVTWVYMGILAFLGAATLFALPLRYVGDGAGFGQILSRLSFFGLALILPAMVLGFILGARTYRVEKHLGRRAGAFVGAIVGWMSYFVLVWSAVAFDFGGRDEAFRPVLFAGLANSFIVYAFVPLALAATALVSYALFVRGASFDRRRRLTFLSAGLAVLAGASVVATGPDLLGMAGALVSTLAGAVGGRVSGGGYARAGGDSSIPPGATIRPREPRRKPQ